MVNSLTRQTGLKLGPIILDVLVKHYFDRLRKDQEAKHMPKLMQEELLYDEAFNIIRVSSAYSLHSWSSRFNGLSPQVIHGGGHKVSDSIRAMKSLTLNLYRPALGIQSKNCNRSPTRAPQVRHGCMSYDCSCLCHAATMLRLI